MFSGKVCILFPLNHKTSSDIISQIESGKFDISFPFSHKDLSKFNFLTSSGIS